MRSTSSQENHLKLNYNDSLEFSKITLLNWKATSFFSGSFHLRRRKDTETLQNAVRYNVLICFVQITQLHYLRVPRIQLNAFFEYSTFTKIALLFSKNYKSA